MKLIVNKKTELSPHSYFKYFASFDSESAAFHDLVECDSSLRQADMKMIFLFHEKVVAGNIRWI